MIITRSAFRISFAGGGTDMRQFYRHEAGAVVSVTMDKYIYLSMHPLFNNGGYHLKYFNNEIVHTIDEIKHPIIKEVFRRYGISGVDFNSSSDVPSGTGLGSSSSFTVGLINLCKRYTNEDTKWQWIAEEACDIEIDILKAPIGKQDQYATTYGGMNFIRFNPDESVDMEPIMMPCHAKKQLQNSLMLFYLGNTREAKSILAEQQQLIDSNMPTLRKMVRLAEDLRDELSVGALDNFGHILHDGWMYKKELSSNVSNHMVDDWYRIALKNGATGGKLLGAGQCGFLLLFVPKDKEKLRASIKLYELPFKFSDTGTNIIYENAF